MSRSDLKITYKLHKNKKWLVAVVATTLLVTSGFKIQQIRRENEERNANTEYDIGYNGVNLFVNVNTQMYNFGKIFMYNFGNIPCTKMGISHVQFNNPF